MRRVVVVSTKRRTWNTVQHQSAKMMPSSLPLKMYHSPSACFSATANRSASVRGDAGMEIGMGQGWGNQLHEEGSPWRCTPNKIVSLQPPPPPPQPPPPPPPPPPKKKPPRPKWGTRVVGKDDGRSVGVGGCHGERQSALALLRVGKGHRRKVCVMKEEGG